MRKLSRRQVVAGSAAAAVTMAARPAVEAFAQTRPDTDLNLYCAFRDMVIDNVKCRVRGYGRLDTVKNKNSRAELENNVSIPGPPISLVAGETLHIALTNLLPPYDSNGWNGDHNVPHKLGTTNLHLHGLDIIPHLFDPVGTSDVQAPMIAIEPGQTFKYDFKIPDDMAPGLNWYHPHHHGSTVVQAASGMAGGIVVYGAIDAVPEIKAARDIAMVMQDIALFPVDPDLPPQALGLPAGTNMSDYWTYLPKQNAIWQTFTGQVTMYNPQTKSTDPTKLKGGFSTGDYALRYYLVNGQAFFKEVHNPQLPPSGQPSPISVQLAPMTINVAPGEVIRIRMLNGNSDNYMPIVVSGHEVHLLALDGVNFPTVRTIPQAPINADPKNQGQLQLAPANRAEFLIQASLTPGTYPIVQLQQSQQFLFSAEKVIANLVVAEAPTKFMSLPYNLPVPKREYPLIKPEEIKRVRQVVFSGIFPGVKNPYVGIDFLINNDQYHHDVVNTPVVLEDCEEWHLIVEGKHRGGTEGHPFHIHVNSFEVISIDGKPVEPGTIKDVVWIPQHSRVVIRTKFQTWVGKSVFHCHILPHEDTGMMQNFLILPKGAKFGQIAPPPSDWPICTSGPQPG